MLPNCVLIGAQKSASTFMHRCLGEHPDVFSPRREIHLFEGQYYSDDRVIQLENSLEKGASKRIVAIKQPRCLPRPECPARVARHLPDAQLLVMLRNPVERAVSAYFHYINYGFIPPVNIEKGILNILNNKYERFYPAASEIIEFGFFHKHIRRYLDYFSREKILITLYDDIRSDSMASVQAMYRFLGISDNYVPKALTLKPQSVIYSMARLNLLSLRTPFYFKYIYIESLPYPQPPSLLGRAMNRLAFEIDSNFMKKICSDKKPQLSQKLQSILKEIYREDIEGLESLLSRDLRHWKE